MFKRVFVYGTLKKGFPNHSHIIDGRSGIAKFIATGRTKHKYPLVLDHNQGNLPFLLNHRGIGKNVLGEIYEVDEQKLKYLDWFEEVGVLYDAIDILVVAECGEEIECTCYVMHNDSQEILHNKHLEYYTSEQAQRYDINYSIPDSVMPEC